MIIVDVYVPSVDETFDFQLDENAESWRITEEMIGMIAQKTKSRMTEETGSFVLYSKESGLMIPRTESLYTAGIRDGSTLILV